MRDSRAAFRARRKATDAMVDAAVAAVRAEKDADWQQRRDAARAASAARVRFTAADITGATHVRDRFGWHEVVRVNAKTVTVKTAYSWTDRVPVDKVIDFKAATS